MNLALPPTARSSWGCHWKATASPHPWWTPPCACIPWYPPLLSCKTPTPPRICPQEPQWAFSACLLTGNSRVLLGRMACACLWRTHFSLRPRTAFSSSGPRAESLGTCWVSSAGFRSAAQKRWWSPWCNPPCHSRDLPPVLPVNETNHKIKTQHNGDWRHAWALFAFKLPLMQRFVSLNWGCSLEPKSPSLTEAVSTSDERRWMSVWLEFTEIQTLLSLWFTRTLC